MIISLASPPVALALDDGLEYTRQLIVESAVNGAAVVCFPEAYLPGLRGWDFAVPDFQRHDQDRILPIVSGWARQFRIAVILGMENCSPEGKQIAALVWDAHGHLLGGQTKNQLDPSEDQWYVAGSGRRLFEIQGTKFGVTICHEGFRYPETVRWAAARGAQIVFHPHCTGSDRAGVTRTSWAEADAPYYEQAMMMRSRENTIYFASVNYAFQYQDSATCLITPDGTCQAYQPYGKSGVLVQEIDLKLATGLLARRYAPERYLES